MFDFLKHNKEEQVSSQELVDNNIEEIKEMQLGLETEPDEDDGSIEVSALKLKEEREPERNVKELSLQELLNVSAKGLREVIGEELDDDLVTDIEWGGENSLWITQLNRGIYKSEKVIPAEVVENFATQLANKMHVPFHKNKPFLEADTGDGLRVSIWHEAFCGGSKHMVIRKVPMFLRYGHNELVNEEVAPEELINLLENCVIAHMNCVIGGQPHAGKTELLKYLSTFIPATESVGVYEDNREIHYKEINPGKRAVEGIISDKKGAGYSEAIRAGLRHNIDWILLSESRGVEVFDLMNALSTGSNCMTTVHLDDLRLLPDRFHEMLSGVTVSVNFKNSVYKYINVAVLVVCDKHQRRKIKQVAFFTRKDGVNRCHMIYEDGEFTTEKFPADIIKSFEQCGIVDPLS